MAHTNFVALSVGDVSKRLKSVFYAWLIGKHSQFDKSITALGHIFLCL